ncbi:MAG: S-layer homology domain-containing protein [Cohnella sp.]|nr:S-layer homology domain-containing protein [Cohnella sp.]
MPNGALAYTYEDFYLNTDDGYYISNVYSVNIVYPSSASTNAAAPSITTQPTGKTVNIGDAGPILNVTASVSDAGTLSYQWYGSSTNSNSGGTLIAGATSASYAASTTTAGTTYYYVEATNTNNAATGSKTAVTVSDPAAIVVRDAYGITFYTSDNDSIDGSGSSITKTAGDKDFIFTAAPTEDSESAPFIQVYSDDSNGDGVYSWSGGDSVVHLTMTIEQGYMFDLESFDYSADERATQLKVGYTRSGAAPMPEDLYPIDSNDISRVETISKAVTNLTGVDFVADEYIVLQHFVVTNIRPIDEAAPVDAETPSIGTQPADKIVNVGGTATLSVAASVSDGGTLSYQWYSNTTNSNSGGTLIPGTNNATYSAPTGSAGTTYYYVVVTNTDPSKTGVQTATATSAAAQVTVNALTNAAAPSISTQPSDQTVSIGGTADLTVAATASGTLSYQWYSNTTNSNSGGTLIVGATSSTFAAPTSTAGTTYYYVVITNTNNAATGAKSATATSSAAKVTVNAPTITQNPPPQTSTPSETEQKTGVNVLVNGKVENAGTATTSKVNGQSVTTINVDQKKLEDKLASEGDRAVVTIPVNTGTSVVVGELNGQMVKNMESKQAVLELKTEQATYTLPARQINIDAVSGQIGGTVALQDIKVHIEIAEPSDETVKIVENAADKGSFTLVVPPLNFNIKGTYGGTTIEVSKFNAYVERTVVIPDGIDPSKITTGVVVEPDGTVRHVPTKIILIDGKYYAKINSLTNSTYSVVWHPREFSDVVNHWAKDAVNDMGSRMVIDGTGNGMFNPDQPVTRAEFTAIVVRGLGLRLNNEGKPFSDVQSADWYNSAINAAYEYQLIAGYDDGEFRPNERLSREEAAVILARAMKLTSLVSPTAVQTPEDMLHAFTDAAVVSVWAQSSMAACVQAGIITGKPGMKLAPEDDISRAEVAAMIQRLLQKANLI